MVLERIVDLQKQCAYLCWTYSHKIASSKTMTWISHKVVLRVLWRIIRRMKSCMKWWTLPIFLKTHFVELQSIHDIKKANKRGRKTKESEDLEAWQMPLNVGCIITVAARTSVHIPTNITMIVLCVDLVRPPLEDCHIWQTRIVAGSFQICGITRLKQFQVYMFKNLHHNCFLRRVVCSTRI